MFATLAIIALSASISFAQTTAPATQADNQSVIQSIGDGHVNWTLGYITAKGAGAPNPSAPNLAVARLGCERAAKLDAQRNLMETTKGVQLDSVTLVHNFMTEEDVIATRVQGILEGAEPVGEIRYYEDTSCEITMRVPITGKLADVLLPKDTGTTEVPTVGKPVYTGLIIDTKGLNIVPAMSPKVVDSQGNEVYGTAVVSRDFAIDKGIAGYTKDVARAKTNDRVGDNPLIITAIKAHGKRSTDVVISDADAAKLRDAGQNLSFLRECRVIIVVD